MVGGLGWLAAELDCCLSGCAGLVGGALAETIELLSCSRDARRARGRPRRAEAGDGAAPALRRASRARSSCSLLSRRAAR